MLGPAVLRPGARRTSPARLTGPWAVAACGIALLPMLSTRPLLHGASLALLHVLVTLLIVRSELRRGWRWAAVSPIALIAVSWTIFLALPAVGAYEPARADYRLGFNENYITAALIVSLGSLGLLYLGYRFGTRPQVPTAHPHQEAPRSEISRRRLALLLAVGWAGRLYLIQQGAYGYTEFGRVQSGLIVSVLDLADGLVPFGLAVLTWVALTQRSSVERRRIWYVLAVVAVPLVISALISGFKAQLLTDLIPALLVHLALRRRIPLGVVIGLVAYLVFTYVGVQGFRVDIAEGQLSFAQGEGAVAAATAVVDRVATGVTSASVGEQAAAFAGHYARSFGGMSRNLGVILHRTPEEIPPLGLQRYLRAPLFFLPMGLLGHEEMPVGQYVNVVYLEGGPTSSSPPTQPGDLYMSGGWGAVVAGALLLGWLLAKLWLWVQAHPQRLLLYAILAAALVNAGEDLGHLVRGGLQTALIYGVVVCWLFGSTPAGPTALLRWFGLRSGGLPP